MRKLFLGISAVALICIAGFVAAQAAAQDRTPATQGGPTQDRPTQDQSSDTPNRTPATRDRTPAVEDQSTTDDAAKTASQPDQGTRLRLAAMDTSAAAFRKLDEDNDGRISALEAADNPRVAAAFTMADQDKDGYLSKEEFESMRSAANRPSDVDASSPSGDRVSEPSGDRPATGPNEPSPGSTAPAPRATATPRPKH